MHLSSGNLDLKNKVFLLADEDLACEEILIELTVIRNFMEDTRTILKQNLATVVETDCENKINKPSPDDS